MVFRWWTDDGPKMKSWLGNFVIFQGIRDSIAQKPYSFVVIHGVGGQDPLSQPLDPHMSSVHLAFIHL